MRVYNASFVEEKFCDADAKYKQVICYGANLDIGKDKLGIFDMGYRYKRIRKLLDILLRNI